VRAALRQCEAHRESERAESGRPEPDLRAILTASIDAERDERSLMSFPRVDPNEEQTRRLVEVIRLAKRCGLSIPPRLTVEWVDADPTVQRARGRTVCYAGPPERIVVTINANLDPDDIPVCGLHEAVHVSDFSDPALRYLPRLEHELRACRFTARILGRSW